MKSLSSKFIVSTCACACTCTCAVLAPAPVPVLQVQFRAVHCSAASLCSVACCLCCNLAKRCAAMRCTAPYAAAMGCAIPLQSGHWPHRAMQKGNVRAQDASGKSSPLRAASAAVAAVPMLQGAMRWRWSDQAPGIHRICACMHMCMSVCPQVCAHEELGVPPPDQPCLRLKSSSLKLCISRQLYQHCVVDCARLAKV